LSGVHSEDLIELKRPFLFFVIDVSFFLFFGYEKFGSGLFFVDGWVIEVLLNPL
jgi:hypothetical protein